VLGIELTNGDLLPKDWPRAYALMTRAAAQGLSPAATSLAQMDQFVPLAERQKGIALARQMERGAPVAVAALQKAPRIAGAVPAPARTAPAPKPAVAAATSNRAPAPVARPIAGGGWRAQLGAYGSPAAAQAQWGALSRKIGALSGLQPSYEQAGKFTRLRAGPLPSRAAADKVCASAKAAGQACFPVAP
jgi:cell division septation protein DedD